MRPRLRLALRAGMTAAIGLLLVQAAAATALATALPEVGHVHPDGADPHAHTIVEVGGVGAPVVVAAPPPRPAFSGRAPRTAAPAAAPGPRVGRANLGRGPPVKDTLGAFGA